MKINDKTGIARKAQTWTTDALIAVGIFVVVLIVFFSFTGRTSQTKKVEDLGRVGEQIPLQLSSRQNISNLTFIEGTKINSGRLATFSNKSYEEIKRELGVSAEFCIHLEDGEGNIVFVNSSMAGIGSGRASISGYTCGDVYPGVQG